MNTQQLVIDQQVEVFKTYEVTGDGACFFRTVSLSLFGTDEFAINVRTDVVNFVTANYDQYNAFIVHHETETSMTVEQYRLYMILPSTFATFVEVFATSTLFQRRIVIVEGHQVICDVGHNSWERIVSVFSGPRERGHFDLLLPSHLTPFFPHLPYTTPAPIQPPPQSDSHIETDPGNPGPSKGRRKAGRPKKVKRGKRKPSSEPTTDRNAKAVTSYTSHFTPLFQNLPYTTLTPFQPPDQSDSHIKTDPVNPGPSSGKRKVGRPKKVKRGRRKTSTRSTIDRSAKAVKQYTKTHPEVHRRAVKHYTDSHAGVNHDTTKRYRNKNIQLPTPLRKDGLIGNYMGKQLDQVKQFSLKNTSLTSDKVNRCQHCQAPLFFEETGRLKWCCGEGAYIVPELPPLQSNFYQYPQFMKSPRAYNNMFSFSALGVSHGFQHPKTGITFLKIQGRTYHRVFDLAYTDTSNPCGMYIDDGEERARLAEGLSLNQTVIKAVTDYLYAVNPFITLLKQLNQEPSDEAHLIFQATTRQSHGPILGDAPRGTEVAAIISTERERFNPHQIVIWKIGAKKPHTVDIFHPLYESLQYPLLYPHGTPGWHIGLVDTKGKKLSQVKYYRRLLLSEPRFSNLGRLSEEWLVDMYCRVEEERLRYVSRMQGKDSSSSMRSAPFSELQENLARNDNTDVTRDVAADETIQGEGGVVPGRVYLPSSFTGGPRYMKTKYMDGMSIVSRLGKPSYFLTITCNPKWPEIIDSSTPGCKAPAQVVSRVFKLKLLELLRDIRCGGFFGRKVYMLYVIEFQKRGLPHAHICFRVEGGGPKQNVDIDKVVRADIPLLTEADGRLRDLVLTHMLHGPCGPSNRKDLPCWDSRQQKCTKHFPKAYTDVTHVDDRGFVHYRRDSNNRAEVTSRRKSIMVNDTWIVPYNSSLLLKYNCHINLEIASTRKIVKYLFKYINKGPDEASVAVISDINNEVETYVTKRYIGACDAAWHTLEFEISGREPNVIQLPVHLEGQHTVVFRPGEEANAARNASSNLLLYFNRPNVSDFHNLTYLDFFEQYIVHSKRPKTSSVPIIPHPDGVHFITKRQRGEMVARLFWVSPTKGEQFYLRILLNSFPSRGYNDLLSLGGEGCATFQGAARSLGLINDELEYEGALEEASRFMTGVRLRKFFVLLLVSGVRGADLWDIFKSCLCEDYLEKFPEEPEKAYSLALIQIDRSLRRHGSRLTDHGLPHVTDNSTELGRELQEHCIPKLVTFTEEWFPRLTCEQRSVFDYIDQLVKDRNCDLCRVVFVDGPAGTGKTVLLKVLAATFRSVKQVVLCTATSGIAAQNYEGGMTAHSMFKLPLDINDDTVFWGITGGSQRAELIREAAVIIFDEAPMAHKNVIHILERSLRDLMQSNKPFGNKIVVFAGDFRQIPPVVVGARSSSEVVSASLRCSFLWPSIRTFMLMEAQRTRLDSLFSDLILQVGNGTLLPKPIGEGREKESLIPLNNLQFVTDLSALIEYVFPPLVLSDPDSCTKRAVLCVTNDNVDAVNRDILETLLGEPVRLLSVSYLEDGNAEDVFMSADALANIHAKGVPDHELVFKKNAVCMITRNLHFDDGLLNGTKVIIVDISPRLVTVRKPGEVELFSIPRITFQMSVEPGSPLKMYRRQFPLKLSYAMTINKSQGQTIDVAGVDLRSDVFTHGQLYVALGRVRSFNTIKVLVRPDRVLNGTAYVKNVVFSKLL